MILRLVPGEVSPYDSVACYPKDPSENKRFMTTNEALQFLREHQPLPPTRVIEDAVIQEFDRVVKHFGTHLDARCVPLILNAFGEGDGHGVYQVVEDTILRYPDNVVVPSLLEGLRSPIRSVRTWNAEIAANYPNPELASPLIQLLWRGDVDERSAAVIALARYPLHEIEPELTKALNADMEAEVTDLIRDVLQMRLDSTPK